MLSLDVGQFVQPLIVFEDSIVELLVQTFNSIPIDLDTTDMSFSYCPSGETLLLCFLLLKIWVLLTLLQRQRIMVHQQSQAMDKPAFWMSVWPALRRFLGRIDSSTLSKVKDIAWLVPWFSIQADSYTYDRRVVVDLRYGTCSYRLCNIYLYAAAPL